MIYPKFIIILWERGFPELLTQLFWMFPFQWGTFWILQAIRFFFFLEERTTEKQTHAAVKGAAKAIALEIFKSWEMKDKKSFVSKILLSCLF